MSRRTSYWFVLWTALLIGAIVFASGFAVDWMLHDVVRRVYASDVLDAVVAAILSGIALLRMQRRRHEMLVRMQIIEDVNHHVRNALTQVTFSAALHDDPELSKQVQDAAERIDWVLRDVLPMTVDGHDVVADPARWSAGAKRYIA